MNCEYCEKMHRRAQVAEGEAIATSRRFEGALAEVAKRLATTKHRVSRWSKNYRAVREKLFAAMVPDHTDEVQPFSRIGDVLVLLDRLIAQRDPSHELCIASIQVRNEEIARLRQMLADERSRTQKKFAQGDKVVEAMRSSLERNKELLGSLAPHDTRDPENLGWNKCGCCRHPLP